MEDARERMIHEWDLAKLVLSGIAGKGVKALDKQDKDRLEAEKERRGLVQDKWLFDKLDIPYIDHSRLFKDPSKKTWQDLEAEAESWFAGEKDFHDRVIDDYMIWVEKRKTAMVKESEERTKAALEAAAAFEHSAADLPLVGYTMEQLRDFFPNWNPGVKTVDTRKVAELPKVGR
jgi:hypothetical protein